MKKNSFFILLTLVCCVIFIAIALRLINFVKANVLPISPEKESIQQTISVEDVTSSFPYISGEPIRVEIPRLSIDLEVINGNYYSLEKKWNLSDTKAQYATVSALPNNRSGNTMLYGHNTNKVFGRTKNIQPGDDLYLYLDNNAVFVYKYSSDRIVSPKDTDIIIDSPKPELTLITCTGLFDEKRRLLTFNFKGIRKI